MSLTTVQQRESELIAEFTDAPAGLACGTRLALDKKPTSLNALKHGLTGNTLFISLDDLPYFAEMGLGFMREIGPVGVRETGNAQFLFESRWRLHRILAVENNLFWISKEDEFGNAHVLHDDLARQVNAFRQDAHHIELISRYETRILRNSERVDQELDRLQKRRGTKQPFDEESCPAVAWYRRLLQRAAALKLAQNDAKSEPENTLAAAAETTDRNTHQNPKRKRLTQAAAAGSSPNPFCKKDSQTEGAMKRGPFKFTRSPQNTVQFLPSSMPSRDSRRAQ